MPIKDVMSTKLITVTPDEQLGRLQVIIEKTHIHHILVVENGALAGIISDRDVLRNISPFTNTGFEAPRDSSILKMKASQIMTKNPTTISQDASIREAGKIILEMKVGLLPAIDSKGMLVGVISWKDVLRFAIK